MLITEILQYQTGWLPKRPFDRMTWIGVDLEKSSLLIKTDSAEGSLDKVNVWFNAADDERVGVLNIAFGSPPKYSLGLCSEYEEDFQRKIPSERIKVWRITLTRNPGSTLVINCNDLKVLEMKITYLTCDHSSWETHWGKDVQKIWFSDDDSASDLYSFYTVFDSGERLSISVSEQNFLRILASAIMHNFI